jgi:hypothetical protein
MNLFLHPSGVALRYTPSGEKTVNLCYPKIEYSEAEFVQDTDTIVN